MGSGVVVPGKQIVSCEGIERPANRAHDDDAEQHEEPRAALDPFLSGPNHIAGTRVQAAFTRREALKADHSAIVHGLANQLQAQWHAATA